MGVIAAAFAMLFMKTHWVLGKLVSSLGLHVSNAADAGHPLLSTVCMASFLCHVWSESSSKLSDALDLIGQLCKTPACSFSTGVFHQNSG